MGWLQLAGLASTEAGFELLWAKLARLPARGREGDHHHQSCFKTLFLRGCLGTLTDKTCILLLFKNDRKYTDKFAESGFENSFLESPQGGWMGV